MQSIRWIAFGIANATTRTALHFYPSAGNVTAPYPVSCKLSIFGAGLDTNPIAVDGLRLSQPEGIWIDEAFPVLKSANVTWYGVEIALTCNQHRVELDGSSCVVELQSLAQSTRYWPICAEGCANRERPRTSALVRDAFSISSIVAINPTAIKAELGLALGAYNTLEIKQPPATSLPALDPRALTEIPLDAIYEESFAPIKARDYSWGMFRARSVSALNPADSSLIYVLHRDAASRRIVSVCGL